jgi:hypothetical protein
MPSDEYLLRWYGDPNGVCSIRANDKTLPLAIERAKANGLHIWILYRGVDFKYRYIPRRGPTPPERIEGLMADMQISSFESWLPKQIAAWWESWKGALPWTWTDAEALEHAADKPESFAGKSPWHWTDHVLPASPLDATFFLLRGHPGHGGSPPPDAAAIMRIPSARFA